MANNEIPRWAQAALERNERIQSKARSAVALLNLMEERDRLSRLAPDTLGVVDPNYSEEVRYEAPGVIRDPESWLNRGLETLAGNAADVILGRPSENPVVDYGLAPIPGVGAAAILGAGGQPGLVDAAGVGGFFGGLGRLAKTAVKESPRTAAAMFKGIGALTPKQVAELEIARQRGKVPDITDPRHLPVVPYEMERMVLPEENIAKAPLTREERLQKRLEELASQANITGYPEDIADVAVWLRGIGRTDPTMAKYAEAMLKEEHNVPVTKIDKLLETLRGEYRKLMLDNSFSARAISKDLGENIKHFEKFREITDMAALRDAYRDVGEKYRALEEFKKVNEELKALKQKNKMKSYVEQNIKGEHDKAASLWESIQAEKAAKKSGPSQAALDARAAEKALAEFKRRQNQFTKKPDKALAEAQEQGISLEEWLGKPEGAEYNKQAQKLLEKYSYQPAPKVEPVVEPVAEPVAVVEVPKKEVDYVNPDEYYPEAFIDDEAEAVEATRRRNPNEALAYDLIDWDYDPDIAALAKARKRGEAYDIARVADNVIKDEPTATAKVLLGGPNKWRENGWSSERHNPDFYRQFGRNMSEESKRDIYVADSLAKHWASQLLINPEFRKEVFPKRGEPDPTKIRPQARHNLTNYDEISKEFRRDLARNILRGNAPGKALKFRDKYKANNTPYGYKEYQIVLDPEEKQVLIENSRIWPDEQEGPSIYDLLFRTRVERKLNEANPNYWESFLRW